VGKIAICGDSVVDEFIYSKSKRLSPEAPVAIAEYLKTQTSPGGAANVVMNSVAAGSRSILISRIGNSQKAIQIMDDWLNNECEVVDLDPHNYLIPIKTRFMVDGVQTVRIDRESVEHLEWTSELISKYEDLTKDCDFIIVSDYGKGFFNSLEMLPASTLKKSIVDPFGTNWEKYRGCLVLKPNLAELGTFIGSNVTKDNLEDAVKHVMEVVQPGHLVVTLGADGVMWTSDGLDFHYFKETPKTVVDVSGAGDTFAAFFTTELSTGASVEDAVKVASRASGLAVERTGTSIVYRHELHLNNKVISETDLTYWRKIWIQGDKKIVFTNGCFDLIHAGHISLLIAAKKMGDILVVGINSDGSVKRLKGDGRPLNKLADRITVLQSIDVVDYLVVFGEQEEDNDNPFRIISALSPHVLVKGGDYSESQVIGAEWVKSYGGNTYIHETLEGLSTTAILQKGTH
jgi:D-beta-D-heptose 7-phosphate kinase/D-beta-D-heptose 1-phosphate adenosyltransferase